MIARGVANIDGPSGGAFAGHDARVTHGDEAPAVGMIDGFLRHPDGGDDADHVHDMQQRHEGNESNATGHCTTHDEPGRHRHTNTRGDRLRTAPSELIAVAPRRELRTLRLADAHQLRTVGQAGQSDIVRAHPHARIAKRSLALLDRLPPLVERCEIPALTATADDPEPTVARVECDATSDG